MLLLLIGVMGIVVVGTLLLGLSLCRAAAEADRWAEEYAAERQAQREDPPVLTDDLPKRAA